MGCNEGSDISCRLQGFLLWLIFDALLSIEGEVDIANIWREGVDLCAAFFGDEVDKSDAGFANIVPSTGETLKAVGRDVEGLSDGWLGRILLGGSKYEGQG